jgi:hypothetical protein
MPHGNKSRAIIATNANMGTNASLNGRNYGIVISAKRSRLSHFRHRCAITFATITPDPRAARVLSVPNVCSECRAVRRSDARSCGGIRRRLAPLALAVVADTDRPP